LRIAQLHSAQANSVNWLGEICLTKVTSTMTTRARLDEEAFEQLLAAAILLQQQRDA